MVFHQEVEWIKRYAFMNLAVDRDTVGAIAGGTVACATGVGGIPTFVARGDGEPSSLTCPRTVLDYHDRMATIEVGIRIDPAAGVSFFGVEAVNKQLAAGLRVREIRPGGLLTLKTGEQDGNVQFAFSGCQILVVFESD